MESKTFSLGMIKIIAGLMVLAGVVVMGFLGVALITGTVRSGFGSWGVVIAIVLTALLLSGGRALWSLRWWGLWALLLVLVPLKIEDIVEAESALDLAAELVGLGVWGVVGLSIWRVLRDHHDADTSVPPPQD
jgi:hypothetical protein